MSKSPTQLSFVSKCTGYLNFYDFTNSHYTHEALRDWEPYLELNQTRVAIHVEGVQYLAESRTVYENLHSDIIKSMEPNFTALIPHYKVMVYVGNLDMLVGPAQVNALLEKKGKILKDQE